jgi:hypothetical protein
MASKLSFRHCGFVEIIISHFEIKSSEKLRLAQEISFRTTTLNLPSAGTARNGKGACLPMRIEIAGNSVSTLRRLDPETLRELTRFGEVSGDVEACRV